MLTKVEVGSSVRSVRIKRDFVRQRTCSQHCTGHRRPKKKKKGATQEEKGKEKKKNLKTMLTKKAGNPWPVVGIGREAQFNEGGRGEST